MIDLKDIENVEVLDLKEEQQREVSGGRNISTGGHVGKQGTESTLMDAIYHFAWENWYY